jgi:hypothetical protein
MALSSGYPPINERGTNVLLRLTLAGLGLLMLPGAAFAQDDLQSDGMRFSGSLTGGYSNSSSPYLHVGDANVEGSAVVTLDDPGFNLQANFNNQNIFSAALRGADFSYGGDAYWRDYKGSIGLTFGSHSTSDGSHADFSNYGGFGQWFLFSNATLQAKGGYLAGRYRGYYGDLGAVVYPYSFLALELTGDYAKDNRADTNLKDIELNAEFLPVRDIPVTMSIGYTRSEYNNLPNIATPDFDTYLVSIKVYFGTGSQSTLVDYQRRGAVDWDSPPAGIATFAY